MVSCQTAYTPTGDSVAISLALARSLSTARRTAASRWRKPPRRVVNPAPPQAAPLARQLPQAVARATVYGVGVTTNRTSDGSGDARKCPEMPGNARKLASGVSHQRRVVNPAGKKNA